MKLAILVYGEYRQFDISVKSWKFLDDFDCDVYVSTWDKSVQINKNLDINLVQDITEEKIRNLIPDAKILILNEERDYPLKNNDYERDRNSRRLLFHWYKLNEMMKQSNVQYDGVFLIRNDLYVTNYQKCVLDRNDLEDRIIGLNHIQITGNNEYFLPDVYFYGTQKNISNMIDLLDYENPPNIHTYIARVVLELGLYVEKETQFSCEVLRPNCIGMENFIHKDIVTKLQHWDNTVNM